MSNERLCELLQAIESKANEGATNIAEVTAAMAVIKTDATAALALDPPQGVADVLNSIKAIACEVYEVLMIGQAMLTTIAGSAAAAILLK